MKFLASVTVVCLLNYASAEDLISRIDDADLKLQVSGSGSEDLESSATGYIFNRNGIGQGQLFNGGGLSSGLSSGYNYGSGLGIGSIGGGSGSFGSSGGLGQFSSGSGFNFPTKYSIGGYGGGGIGSSEYNLGGYNGGLGIGGLGYGGGVGGFSQGNLGYGISKNGLGLGGLTGVGAGIGLQNLGSGVIQSGGLGQGGLGYSGLTGGVGVGLGQYVPITGSLGGLGQAGIGGVANEAAFKKGEGANFQSGQEAVASDKGEKGYKVSEAFDKGEKGKIDQENHLGGYNSAGGLKKGEAEEAKKYAESAAAAKGEKGESFHKSGGHKKGHKTSGFHNVYHKDEFKKDTSFYDDNHNNGHQESYGSEDKNHKEAEGAYEKEEKLDAAHLENNQAKKGSFTNGHQYGAVQGHDREEGEKEHFDKGIEYANQLGHKGGKEYGESGGNFIKKIY